MSGKCFRSLLVLAVLLSVGLTACESMKAKPSEGAGFVPMNELSHREDLPFNRVWAKEGVDWKAYKTLYIEEVNVQHLLKANWWQQSLRREEMEDDVKNIARYMRQRFQAAFREDPLKRFEVVNTPEPGSLTMEFALTELVPSNPVLEAMSIAAPYGSGVAIQAAARGSGAKATVAFEARIKDTDTGTVLAMFADREQGKFAPINLRALTWYGEADVILDEWAEQMVQVAHKKPGEIIKASRPFTLKPW